MSNFEQDDDKLNAHLEELKRKHRALDEEIAKRLTVTQEVRQMKTQKLFLKDEIHRIETKLSTMDKKVNGF